MRVFNRSKSLSFCILFVMVGFPFFAQATTVDPCEAMLTELGDLQEVSPTAVFRALAAKKFHDYQLKGLRLREARNRARGRLIGAGWGSVSSTSELAKDEPPKAPDPAVAEKVTVPGKTKIDPRFKDIEMPKGIVVHDLGPDGAVGVSESADRIFLSRHGGEFREVAEIIEPSPGSMAMKFGNSLSDVHTYPGSPAGKIRSVAYRDGVIYALVLVGFGPTNLLMSLDLKSQTVTTHQSFWCHENEFAQIKLDQDHVYVALAHNLMVYDHRSSNFSSTSQRYWTGMDHSPIKQISAKDGRVATLETNKGYNIVTVYDSEFGLMHKWKETHGARGVRRVANGISFISKNVLLISYETPNGTLFDQRNLNSGKITALDYPADIGSWSLSPEARIFYWRR